MKISLCFAVVLGTTKAFLHKHGVCTSRAVVSSSALLVEPKARGKVIVDPKTGLYRPVKRIPGANSSSSNNNSGSGWDNFKNAVYKGVDGLSALPTTLEQITQGSKTSENTVVGGYADLERELGATAAQPLKKTATPIDKLLNRSKSPSTTASTKPLIPPTNLEKAKDFFWKTIDAAKQAQASQTATKTTKTSSTMASAMESFQPTVRARLIASDEFLQAMGDLDSPNPVVRLAAGRRIRKLAQTQQKQLQKDGPNPLTQLKAAFYNTVDQVEATGKEIAALPDKAVATYEATVFNTQMAVAAAKRVPSQVESQVAAAQKTVQDTVEATQQAAETVQKLPSTIQTSIQTTKEDVEAKVQATVDTAQKVQSTVQSLTTQSKVLLGLEKPQPKPPTTPPPEPLTASKAAWKVLSISTNLAAQTTWFVGKNGAKLAWKLGSIAAEKGGEVVETQMKEFKAQQKNKVSSKVELTPTKDAKSTAVKAPSATTSASTVKTPSSKESPTEDAAPLNLEAIAEQQEQEMSALELEIEEALRLADAAIQSAQDEIASEEQKRKDDLEGSRS